MQTACDCVLVCWLLACAEDERKCRVSLLGYLFALGLECMGLEAHDAEPCSLGFGWKANSGCSFELESETQRDGEEDAEWGEKGSEGSRRGRWVRIARRLTEARADQAQPLRWGSSEECSGRHGERGARSAFSPHRSSGACERRGLAHGGADRSFGQRMDSASGRLEGTDPRAVFKILDSTHILPSHGEAWAPAACTAASHMDHAASACTIGPLTGGDMRVPAMPMQTVVNAGYDENVTISNIKLAVGFVA